GRAPPLLACDRLPRTPTVFCGVPETVRRELTGAWITVVTTDVPPALEFPAWRRVVPEVHRVAMFYGAATGAALARAAHAAAAASGLELGDVPVDELRRLGA